MKGYVISRTIISDLGRTKLPDEFVEIHKFIDCYEPHFEKEGFKRETYFQPLGNIELSKYDSEGNLMLVSCEYTEKEN